MVDSPIDPRPILKSLKSSILQLDSLDLPIGFTKWIDANDASADKSTLEILVQQDIKESI